MSHDGNEVDDTSNAEDGDASLSNAVEYEEDDQSVVASTIAPDGDDVSDTNNDDDRSTATPHDQDEDEEGSNANNDETLAASPKNTPSRPTSGSATPTKGGRKIPPSSRRGRAPAVKGLTIPFRTVKKAMKLDPDTPIVQNEAAIMTTLAAELFLRNLSKSSYSIAKRHGRNTIKYEDVAEARTKDASLSFLETLLP